MAAVGTLERVEFECARCGGTIHRSLRPRTCPHCQAKKADRCQVCDRAVYIGALRCPEHAASPDPGRPTAMLPPAPAPVHAPAHPPRWASALARAAIAISLVAPAGLVARNQTRLREARSFQDVGNLLAEDPAGYARVDDATAGTGPVDFERAVREDVEGQAARGALTEFGLERGFTRRWQAGDIDTVDLELFQYETHAGAEADERRMERLVPHVAAQHGLTWSTFPVPTVPGGHGYSLAAADGRGVQVVSFARGAYAAAVTVTSTDQDTARATAIAMAERQRAKLSRLERIELLVSDGLQRIRP